MKVRIIRTGAGWATMAELPVADSEWDRNAYPSADAVIFIDGTDEKAKEDFLRNLPRRTFVCKTGEEKLKAFLDGWPTARKTTEYRSFTSPGAEARGVVPPVSIHSPVLIDAVSGLIQRNGYQPEELTRYFANGAEWFGMKQGNEIASVCFVYQNYGRVWEVAGVYTVPEARRKGLGKQVVAAALDWLESGRLIPRYQVKWDNAASIELAKSCGLVQFLSVNHYVIEAARPR